jgi:hypothetical protein
MLMQRWRVRAAFAVVLVCAAVLVGARTPTPLAAAGEVVFRIGGDVERPQQWTLDDLATLPRREVRARDRDGTEATFAGVALIELLRLAGVPVGEKLRGSNMALYLLVEAADGYRGSLRYQSSIQRLRSVWCCSPTIATDSHSPLRKDRCALWSLMRSDKPAGCGKWDRVPYAAPRDSCCPSRNTL